MKYQHIIFEKHEEASLVKLVRTRETIGGITTTGELWVQHEMMSNLTDEEWLEVLTIQHNIKAHKA